MADDNDETVQYPVVASNGFVVWAPTLAPDATRSECPRHSVGDPDDTCTCPEAAEFDDLCQACGERIATARDNAEFERLRRTDTSGDDDAT